MKNKFKPYVGRFFRLKNYTSLSKFPQVIVVLDEDRSSVSFLDLDGKLTKVSKFYINPEPFGIATFTASDSINRALLLIEKMRSQLAEANAKNIKQLNKDSQEVVSELRNLDDHLLKLGIQMDGKSNENEEQLES